MGYWIIQTTGRGNLGWFINSEAEEGNNSTKFFFAFADNVHHLIVPLASLLPNQSLL